MSTLRVGKLEGLSANSNEIRVPSGHKIVVETGGQLRTDQILNQSGSNSFAIDGSGNLTLGGSITASGGFIGSASQLTDINVEAGPRSCAVWTTEGGHTWNKPGSWCKRIRVEVQGAGGGGSGHGESGAAGGYTSEIIDVTNINSIGLTVGTHGHRSCYSGGAGHGNASNFGNYCGANGGHGANRNHGHSGGLSGHGYGGHMNLHGGGGMGHNNQTGHGGASFWGGAGTGCHHHHDPVNHWTEQAPGAGGTSGFHHHRCGTHGNRGMVVVWEYA